MQFELYFDLFLIFLWHFNDESEHITKILRLALIWNQFCFSDDFENVKGNKWFNSYTTSNTPRNHYCALCRAARNGNLTLVKYLYQNGADINEKNENGQTPLLLAALHGYRSVVKYLYKKGAGFKVSKTPKIEDATPHSRIV